MTTGDFYLGSRKFNINQVRVNLEGDWRKDVVEHPEARYYFKVGEIDCLLKRADDFRYYGTVLLKPTDRDYQTKDIFALWHDIFRFLFFNGYKEKDWYYLASNYIDGLRLITFGLSREAINFNRRGDNIYYSFDESKKLLEGLAKFFAARSKYQLDLGAPQVLFNNLLYNKLT